LTATPSTFRHRKAGSVLTPLKSAWQALLAGVLTFLTVLQGIQGASLGDKDVSGGHVTLSLSR